MFHGDEAPCREQGGRGGGGDKDRVDLDTI